MSSYNITMSNSISNPKVLVLSMTYNHEKYIEDALKGFVMQKTDFPFVVSIIDDASTDNNTSVIMDYLKRVCDADEVNPKIEEYGKVIDATPSNNPNCLLHVVFLSENHFGKRSKRPYYIQFEEKAKYIAMCEGDDYWTDPYKLQKQVDFLESHPDYSMCFHSAKVLSDKKEDFDMYAHLEEREYSACEIYKGFIPPVCIIMYRANLSPWDGMPKTVVYGDVYMILRLGEMGKIYNMNFVGAVYRRNSGGISQIANLSLYKRLYNQFLYMEKLFPQKDVAEYSRAQQELYLRCIIGSDYFPDRWKYRIIYMRRHPRLFFSKFLLITLWQMFHKPNGKNMK